MWTLVLVVSGSHLVAGVVTLQNSSGRHAHGDYYYTAAPYYAPTNVGYYQQHDDAKCGWSGGVMDHMLQLAAAKLGLLGVVKALGAGILSKLPLLLALPVGLLVLALPLLLALFLPIPIFSHHGGSEECSSDCDGKTRRPQVEERISRALAVLVESEACVGRMACELGALNSKSQYKNAVTWLLSHMQRSAPESEQGLLAVYRTAYVKGNEGYSCSNGQYLCDLAPVITAAFES